MYMYLFFTNCCDYEFEETIWDDSIISDFYRILWTTGVDSYAIAGNSRSIALFNVLLWVLQVLHVFWFIMIMSVALKALALGKVSLTI